MAKWTFAACGAVALAAGAVQAAEADLDTLPPGSRLPSAETCATRVLGAGQPRLEDRPSNADENAARYSGPDVLIDGANHLFQARVRGDFAPAGVTLTTREILLIGACKWGFDEQGVFGKAKVESNWFQARGADYGYGDSHTDPAVCARIDKPAPCWTSYGIMQVKGTVHEGTYPWAERSTAFNVDYALGWQRACFEGGFDSWIGNAKGDLEGCVGAWFSGKLRDSVAQGYIAKWNQVMSAKPWYNNRAFLRMDGSPQSLPEIPLRSGACVRGACRS